MNGEGLGDGEGGEGVGGKKGTKDDKSGGKDG